MFNYRYFEPEPKVQQTMELYVTPV